MPEDTPDTQPTPTAPMAIQIVLPESATVTAFCTMVNTIGLCVLEGMRGQTPEQKKTMWQWYVDDVTWWRKFLGLSQ